MRRFLTLLLLVLMLLAGRGTEGGEGRELRRIGRALDLDLSGGTLERLEDTHGGFHGDGKTSAEIAIDGLEEELSNASGWRALPPSENAAQAFRLCGMDTPPEAGFYYLCDRQNDGDPYDDSQLHQRYSWNFTAAVYDSEAGRLYYYKFDT